MLYQLQDRKVTRRGECFVADNATVIGDVDIGHDVSIWFNAVIRGDTDRIIIGDNSNIQDGSVLHTDPGIVLEIGRNVTVGHKVMLHGCTIGDGSLIGINAVVLNNARIGRNCLIGANALIPEGKEIPDGSVVMGSPGKVVKQLTEEQMEALAHGAEHYVENGRLYREHLQPME
ncbi:gamma carbonic anhydrase family protein [Aquisalimonas sp.]|uniref:gamma carbonic anhydrase family protein n=1 Tax=unclassified Aquisalimonas TaxID=2644645 RepID=UPI0025C1054A|nr:gamma carbonic anhydrase family protein [Aquisalimonas sp.]